MKTLITNIFLNCQLDNSQNGLLDSAHRSRPTGKEEKSIVQSLTVIKCIEKKTMNTFSTCIILLTLTTTVAMVLLVVTIARHKGMHALIIVKVKVRFPSCIKTKRQHIIHKWSVIGIELHKVIQFTLGFTTSLGHGVRGR